MACSIRQQKRRRLMAQPFKPKFRLGLPLVQLAFRLTGAPQVLARRISRSSDPGHMSRTLVHNQSGSPGSALHGCYQRLFRRKAGHQFFCAVRESIRGLSSGGCCQRAHKRAFTRRHFYQLQFPGRANNHCVLASNRSREYECDFNRRQLSWRDECSL